MSAETSTSDSAASGDIFATTRWTVVLMAGRHDSPQAERALEELCRAYWYPLYAYVRHRGHAKEDAEDLTQAFFARFLEKNYLEGLDAEHGRFRAFLLASLKHFLANEWDKSQCRKRGGQNMHLSLDWQDADTHFQLAASNAISPDAVYDREWAVALLAQVIERLRNECVDGGKAAQFEALKPYLMLGKDSIPYAEAAAVVGLNEGAVRVTVHRLRKRYRELLRESIAQTLSNPTMIDEEMRVLLGAFG